MIVEQLVNRELSGLIADMVKKEVKSESFQKRLEKNVKDILTKDTEFIDELVYEALADEPFIYDEVHRMAKRMLKAKLK